MPHDRHDGTFVGRVIILNGQSPFMPRGGVTYDVTIARATVAQLIANCAGYRGGPIKMETLVEFDLLSPIDLQCVKAGGVNFAVSAP